jgi:hypothetical protein
MHIHVATSGKRLAKRFVPSVGEPISSGFELLAFASADYKYF